MKRTRDAVETSETQYHNTQPKNRSAVSTIKKRVLNTADIGYRIICTNTFCFFSCAPGRSVPSLLIVVAQM